MADFKKQNRNHKFDQNRDIYRVPKEKLTSILDGEDAQGLVKVADEIAKNELTAGKNKVSSSQIRNVYGTVKRLEMGSTSKDVIFELVMLKPKLAYAVGRHNKIQGMKVLQAVLSDAIDLVSEKKDRFDNFCKFFEAIMAYHKFYGGN